MTVLTTLLVYHPYFLIDQNRTFIQDLLFDESGLTTDCLILLLIGSCITLVALLHLVCSRSNVC